MDVVDGAEAHERPARTPVTIVTGYLGAGKTSLLNKLVRYVQDRRRLAVVENEFGEVNLDGTLVTSLLKSKEDLVCISGGCVCCTMRKDIIRALHELLSRAKASNVQHDNVILETTGLADPGPVAFTFFSHPWVAQRFTLDSVVTVVDAVYFRKCMRAIAAEREKDDKAVHEVINQIAFADVVLLNKIDLVTNAELSEVEAEIRGINTVAQVIHTRLDTDDSPQWLSRILDIESFSLQRALSRDPTFLDEASSKDDDSQNGGSPSAAAAAAADDASPDSVSALWPAADGAGKASSSRGAGEASTSRDAAAAVAKRRAADDAAPEIARSKKPRVTAAKAVHDLGGVRAVRTRVKGLLDKQRFNLFMRDLLAVHSRDILRCKGIVAMHGYSHLFNFQGVHDTLQSCKSREPVPAAPESELIFIGRALDAEAIRAGFATCVAQPLPPGWREMKDPATARQFYVHGATATKTWVRPLAGAPPPRRATSADAGEQADAPAAAAWSDQ